MSSERIPKRKRPRIESPEKEGTISVSQIDSDNPRPCHLSRIPLEILAEILFSTSGPKDVLSLARCSKFFCATLAQNASTNFIWRHLRATFKPSAIPDPTPNFTESSYAAFLFDNGPCEVCQENTDAMYTSFALRLRLCHNTRCLTTMQQNMIKRPGLSEATDWMPYTESYYCLYPREHSEETDVSRLRCRRKDLFAAEQEYDRACAEGKRDAYVQKHKAEAQQLPAIMLLSDKLLSWRIVLEVHARNVKKKNDASGKAKSAQEGWSYRDLLYSPTYLALRQNRNGIYETITDKDFEAILPMINADLFKIEERRKRCTTEDVYRRRREEVEAYYESLQSSNKFKVLPTLAEFRKIPIIQSLQSKVSDSDTTISEELKGSSFFRNMVYDDLNKWIEEARTPLAAVLGFPGWKSTSTRKLHPTDRLTARFKCIKCNEFAKKYEQNGGFDFAGACAHKCSNLSKKQRAKEVWKPAQFVRDDKAINAVENLLSLCGASAEENESFDKVAKLPPRIMCLSCDSAIIMASQCVVGHAHRHDKMEMKILSEADSASIMIHPLDVGLYAKCMSLDYQGKAIREKTIYGCRHCFQNRVSDPSLTENKHLTIGVTAESLPSEEDMEIEAPKTSLTESNSRTTSLPARASQFKGTKADKRARVFNFHGLRSHMKEKHGIPKLRDEDFFSYENITKSS